MKGFTQKVWNMHNFYQVTGISPLLVALHISTTINYTYQVLTICTYLISDEAGVVIFSDEGVLITPDEVVLIPTDKTGVLITLDEAGVLIPSGVLIPPDEAGVRIPPDVAGVLKKLKFRMTLYIVWMAKKLDTRNSI